MTTYLSKHNIYTFLIIASFFILIHTIIPTMMFDLNKHHDILNYHSGYTATLKSGYIFASYNIFGRPPELLFPLLYLTLSKFVGEISVTELTYIHTFLFAFLYPLGVFSYSSYLKKRGFISEKHFFLFSAFILAICPLGLPLQLARQSIAFCLILAVAPFLLNFKQKILGRLLLCLLILTTHMYSILLLLFLLLNPKKHYKWLFLGIATLSILYYEILNIPIVLGLLQIQWGLTEKADFYLYFTLAFVYSFIFVIIFLIFNRLSLSYLIISVCFGVIAFYSNFLFRRLFFGFEFFFFIVYIFDELKKIANYEKKNNNKYRFHISALNNQLVFLITIFIFFAKIILFLFSQI